MDQIIIDELEVRYHVGVPDAERAQPQRLLLTVTMDLDFSKAAAQEDLEETINYFDVCQRLLSFGQGRSWKLIETLGTDIANLILTEFKPVRVTVEVKKFIIPETRYVAIRLTRP